jgi:hypothetical protein
MVERIEHLGPKLNLDLLSYRKCLDKTEVNVPVTRGDEDISSCSIGPRCWQAKGLCQIDAARKWITGRWIIGKPGQIVLVRRRSDLEVHGAELLLVSVLRRVIRDFHSQ